MIVNIKKHDGLSPTDMHAINEAFNSGRFYQEARVESFAAAVERVRNQFEQLSQSNSKIKNYLRLWKGVSQKFFHEIVPFKIFLDRTTLYPEYTIQISDDRTAYDVVVSKGEDRQTFEIVTAYIDEQEIYRTHHLNAQGWVSNNQTFDKDAKANLIPKNELEFVEITPGVETEELRRVLANIKKAFLAKQNKNYENVSLLIVAGMNSVFKQNPYAVRRVKEELSVIHNGKFKNIYILDYGFSEVIKC